MSDDELTELSAKAFNLRGQWELWHQEPRGMWRQFTLDPESAVFFNNSRWNPLYDSEQAFELMTFCNIDVVHDSPDSDVPCIIGMVFTGHYWEKSVEVVHTEKLRSYCLRRVIVKLAALIGTLK